MPTCRQESTCGSAGRSGQISQLRASSFQARLDALAPELEGLGGIEGRYASLEALLSSAFWEKQVRAQFDFSSLMQASQTALSQQSERLRDINGALGAQLLADKGALEEGDMEPVAEAVFRAVQLQQKLQERQESHDSERQKLASKIRELERGGIHQYEQPRQQAGTAPSSGPPGALASATSALRGGLGRMLNKV